jgi:hypothetical protein
MPIPIQPPTEMRESRDMLVALLKITTLKRRDYTEDRRLPATKC